MSGDSFRCSSSGPGTTVLAVLELVLFLDAASDVQEAAAVEPSEVAGPETAVLGEHFGGFRRAAVVAAHDVRPVHDDLAASLAVRGRVDGDADAGDGPADAAELARAGRIHAHDRTGLGQAVALVNRDAERIDEFRDLGGERRGAADGEPQPAAELAAHLREDELVRERQARPFAEAEPRTPSALRRGGEAGREQAADERGPGFHLLADAGVDLVEDPRDGEQHGRPHLREVRHDLLDAFADRDGSAEADEAVQLAGVPNTRLTHKCAGAGGLPGFLLKWARRSLPRRRACASTIS